MSEPLRYQNPELQNLLASNYVIGTLRGPARKRFENLMRENQQLAKRVHQWEEKMQPLHSATAPTPPHKATWNKIINQLSPNVESVIESLKSRLRIYKYLTAMAFTCAFMIGLASWSPWQVTTPGGTSINYVAVLKDNEQNPSMVVTLTKEGRILKLDMLQKPQISDSNDLQLWAISREDGTTQSLGLIELEKHVETNLSKPQWGLIKNAEYLIVSVENPGGSSSGPTGPIISKGLCVKVEGWKSKTG